MIDIISQTNVDTILFIGHDEPHHKIVALNLGLIKKGYSCGGVGSISQVLHNGTNGIRVRFTKSEKQYNKRDVSLFRQIIQDPTNPSGKLRELSVSKSIHRYSNVTVDLKIHPQSTDIDIINETDPFSKFSQHIQTTKEMYVLPEIQATAELDNRDFADYMPEDNEIVAKQHMDTLIVRIKTFEENYKILYPILTMKFFANANYQLPHIMKLTNFDKIIRYAEVLKCVNYPSKSAKNQFIELCEIFKNNNVLRKLKANGLEFIKDSKRLTIEFFGIQIINVLDLLKFKYLDHPGINFCADFLDKSNTFGIIEAKMSKEIISRI